MTLIIHSQPIREDKYDFVIHSSQLTATMPNAFFATKFEIKIIEHDKIMT